MNKQFEVVDGVAVNRGIGWCTHAINPLKYRDKATGKTVNYCQKISPGCKFCYAERSGKRRNSPDFTVPNLALVDPFIDEAALREMLGLRVKGPYPAPVRAGRMRGRSTSHGCVTSLLSSRRLMFHCGASNSAHYPKMKAWNGQAARTRS